MESPETRTKPKQRRKHPSWNKNVFLMWTADESYVGNVKLEPEHKADGTVITAIDVWEYVRVMNSVSYWLWH